MKKKYIRTALVVGALPLFLFAWVISGMPQQSALQTDVPATQETEEEPLARKVVALTFDDGPHEKITPKVLDILKEEGVQATFFLMGEKVEECPKLVKRMVKEGHAVGNHTYSHVDLSSLSTQQAKEEIEHAQEIIEKITGEAPILLRPPFGKVRENEVPKELLEIEWNVDTLDWTGSSAGQILNRVQKQLKPGAIILMHDQYQGTVEALRDLIRQVRQQGYKFVTVEELLLL
ncbi:MAG: polysaccharide deacetylase family protein [Lachnospiraceae bacterium]